MAGYGLPHVRTEFQKLLIIPSLAPHPIQADCEFARHGHLGDFTFASHRQVQELTSPIGVAADGGLRRLHEQETQQRVALLADVTQPLPARAGVLAWDKPQVAADLLAAAKTLRGSG